MRSERLLPRLFLILLVAVLALAGWQWRHGAPLSANLMELVPGNTPDALELQAEQRMQEPLNREMLVLVGHADRQQAVAVAQQLGERWQASGLFEKVQWNLQADLPALREQLLRGRLAMLSAKDREQLVEQPDAFIQQRVQALFDPFTGFSLVPSQDDWLGLTGRIQNSQPQHGSVQLDIGSGALIADADGKSWVLLRARTTGNAFDMKLPLQVADLLQASRAQAGEQGAQLLAASGLLYAANGQQQATREITWVGGGATVGILLLLLLAFRRWRVLLAFVPVLVGTLGKAFGTSGAFVAGSEELIESLIQFARPYIYTTSQPPALACATLKSLELLRREHWRREHLNTLIRQFRSGAEQIGLQLMDSFTPIQPIMIGDSGRAIRLSQRLRERGLLVTAIRPPTVPAGSARLRVTLSAAHTEAQVQLLLTALDDCWRTLEPAHA